MPLPRAKEDGSNGAPVLNILRAHVRLSDVEEHVEPFTVTRKSDGAAFQLDPQFKCSIEVIDDGEDGADNGEKFFESFKYKNTKKDRSGEWENKENSKLGMLTKVVKGENYFEDTSIPELTAEDLEGFEMICQIKSKRNPDTGKILGSTIDWESMRQLPKKLSAVPPADEDNTVDESDFDDLPW
jgi:hypothetical protein